MPSKWCLADLKAYFEEQGWDFAGTYGRIQDLVVKTMIAVEPAIVQLLQKCFVPLLFTSTFWIPAPPDISDGPPGGGTMRMKKP